MREGERERGRGGRERGEERERENYKIILTNKGKPQNNDYLTRLEAKRWCIIHT